MAPKVYPHGPFVALAPGVWCLRGISGIPLHRNMIVVRLADGGLVLHSVVALDEAGYAALAALGRPQIAIVPNRGHQLDAPVYQARFPDLRIVCPEGAREAVAPRVRLAGSVEEVIPGIGWTLHKVPGVKIDEFVYEVPLAEGGRLLIANDVFGNANGAPQSLGGRLLMRPVLGLSGLGIPRIFRWRLVSDMAAVKRFAGMLAAIPGVRLLTVSHGDPVTAGVAEGLRRIAA